LLGPLSNKNGGEDNDSDYAREEAHFLTLYPCVFPSERQTRKRERERERVSERKRCKQNYSPVHGCYDVKSLGDWVLSFFVCCFFFFSYLVSF
jgi:hypothetical protein